LAGWSTNATALGTTAPTIAALTALADAAADAAEAQELAAGLAKSATQNFYDAVTAMDSAASDVIKQIKLKAATGGGNAVYNLAVLPVPATPSPIGPPGTPSGFKATLMPDGTLELTWDCANPAGSVGTQYQVSRRTGSGTGAPFVALASCGRKKFTDTSVPAGVASVTYQVQATRSTAVGAAAQFLVNFGVADGGGAFASVAATSPKLAA
jgi:hypothetical protein